MYGRNLKAYKRTNLEAELSVADPHRIIQMMYDGLIERLSQAKGAILRNDFEYKANRLDKAIGIINGLQTLGLEAIVLTIAGSLGSAIFAWALWRYVCRKEAGK